LAALKKLGQMLVCRAVTCRLTVVGAAAARARPNQDDEHQTHPGGQGPPTQFAVRVRSTHLVRERERGHERGNREAQQSHHARSSTPVSRRSLRASDAHRVPRANICAMSGAAVICGNLGFR